jgi:hypothetical protein
MKAILPLLLISTALAGLAQGTDPTGRRPNIIFILTDDQGYNDMAAHGNPILKTPNLDRLRTEAIRRGLPVERREGACLRFVGND